jgi:hypothetical protein
MSDDLARKSAPIGEYAPSTNGTVEAIIKLRFPWLPIHQALGSVAKTPNSQNEALLVNRPGFLGGQLV